MPDLILQDVIHQLLDTDISLIKPLLRLQYFAEEIENRELLDFVTAELRGYRDVDAGKIPFYRKVPCTIKVAIQVGVYGQKRDFVQLPADYVATPFDKEWTKMPIIDSVGTIEEIIKSINEHGEKNKFITGVIPEDFLGFLQYGIDSYITSIGRVQVIAGYLISSKYNLIGVLDAVRSKLLGFVRKLAQELGHTIQIESFKQNKEANNQTILNIMNQITGDGNIVNTGNNSNINANIQINKGDFNKLAGELRKLGIEEEDIEELKEIVATEQPNTEKKLLGPKANSWIGKITEKALNGAGKISISAAGGVLASLIRSFVGLP